MARVLLLFCSAAASFLSGERGSQREGVAGKGSVDRGELLIADMRDIINPAHDERLEIPRLLENGEGTLSTLVASSLVASSIPASRVSMISFRPRADFSRHRCDSCNAIPTEVLDVLQAAFARRQEARR
jgi:hypothetical protein